MKKKKILIISLITFVLLVVIAISLIIFMPRRYRIPKSTLDIFGETAEGMSIHFIERERYYDYTDVYADKDGNLVFVMTREERDFFRNYLRDILLYSKYEKKEEGIFIEYNADYTEITCECDELNFDEETLDLFMNQMIYYASWYQAFMGVKPEDNRVRLQVIDIDTGEVLYERTVSNK